MKLTFIRHSLDIVLSQIAGPRPPPQLGGEHWPHDVLVALVPRPARRPLEDALLEVGVHVLGEGGQGLGLDVERDVAPADDLANGVDGVVCLAFHGAASKQLK